MNWWKRLTKSGSTTTQSNTTTADAPDCVEAPVNKTVAELGWCWGYGFRLFLQPHRSLTDSELFTAMNLDPVVLLARDPPLRNGMSVMWIARVGSWIQLADDYGLWNDRQRRRAAVEALARLGDLFTFQLPDTDMSYAFALYRGGVRVRLRVVDSRYLDQTLRLEEGSPLVGEPADWRGQPCPIMLSIAGGLGIDVDIATPEQCYGWGGQALRAR